MERQNGFALHVELTCVIPTLPLKIQPIEGDGIGSDGSR